MFKYKEQYEQLYGKFNPIFYIIKRNIYSTFNAICLIRSGADKHSKLARYILQKKYKIILGKNVKIGKNLVIIHPQNIVFGDKVEIGDNCRVYHNCTFGQVKNEYQKIKDNCTFYPGSMVLGNITVGNNSIILAGAVCLKDIADNSMVGGIPAKLIKNI